MGKGPASVERRRAPREAGIGQMHVKHCHGCGRDISANAGRCPYCRKRYFAPVLKRAWIVVAVVGFVLLALLRR
jgi:hypothetical protein